MNKISTVLIVGLLSGALGAGAVNYFNEKPRIGVVNIAKILQDKSFELAKTELSIEEQKKMAVRFMKVDLPKALEGLASDIILIEKNYVLSGGTDYTDELQAYMRAKEAKND